MVRVEIDLPDEIYGFLESVAIFARNPTNEEIYTEEERKAIIDRYIKSYLITTVVDIVKSDAESTSGPLWTWEQLKDVYGLEEMDP